MGLYLVAYFYVEKIVGCVYRLSSGYERKRFLKLVSREINSKSAREIGSYFGQRILSLRSSIDKIPNMNTRKAEMLDFMKRNNITVPEPLPT